MDTETLQQLKLAFAIEHVQRIVDADGVESFEEYQMLGQIFPRALLEAAGFLVDGALTDVWRARAGQARDVLPTLPEAERREVFALLHAASAVDELDARELGALTAAGVALGFSESDVTTMIVDLELAAR